MGFERPAMNHVSLNRMLAAELVSQADTLLGYVVLLLTIWKCLAFGLLVARNREHPMIHVFCC